MLAGAATLLAERRDQLAGDVVLMFQPGEEGYDGAGHMIREGVLDAAGRRADAAYGMHVFSSLEPHGQFATKPGVMLSASDGLFVTVLGAGGHGSAPHAAKDPVTAAAEMVTALQVMITRQFNMFDPVVLTVGVLQAGTTRNVIPESARIEATVRTFSHASRGTDDVRRSHAAEGHRRRPRPGGGRRIPRRVPAEHHGRERDPHRGKDHPEPVWRVQRSPAGPPRSAAPRTSPGSMAEVPGTFIGLSAVAPGADHTPPPFNHSPYATFDDGVLTDGAALYAELAIARIAALAAGTPNVPPLPSPTSFGEIMTTIIDPQLASRAATAEDPPRHRDRQRRRMVRLGHLRHVHALHRQPAVQQGGSCLGGAGNAGDLRRRLRGTADRGFPVRLDRRPRRPQDVHDAGRGPRRRWAAS